MAVVVIHRQSIPSLRPSLFSRNSSSLLNLGSIPRSHRTISPPSTDLSRFYPLSPTTTAAAPSPFPFSPPSSREVRSLVSSMLPTFWIVFELSRRWFMGRGSCRNCVMTGSWSQVGGTRARRRGRARPPGSPRGSVSGGPEARV